MLLALLGPLMLWGIRPSYGEALFWALAINGSILFTKLVVLGFSLDLIFLRLPKAYYFKNAIRTDKILLVFDLASVALIVTFYGGIYLSLPYLLKHT